MMLPHQSRKAHYSEAEAAKELGITVNDLRSLIQAHIVERAEDIENVPRASFHPSDLLVLRLLSSLQTASTA